MTESIQAKLSQISDKIDRLNQSLVTEKLKNTELSELLVQKNRELDEMKGNLDKTRDEVKVLREQSKSTIEQNVRSEVSKSPVSEQEIEELVNEIEYCIRQLKK